MILVSSRTVAIVYMVHLRSVCNVRHQQDLRCRVALTGSIVQEGSTKLAMYKTLYLA
jgi:hypothetical protein